jgi:hypothetical protein
VPLRFRRAQSLEIFDPAIQRGKKRLYIFLKLAGWPDAA